MNTKHQNEPQKTYITVRNPQQKQKRDKANKAIILFLIVVLITVLSCELHFASFFNHFTRIVVVSILCFR